MNSLYERTVEEDFDRVSNRAFALNQSRLSGLPGPVKSALLPVCVSHARCR
uniref:Uncharacterized protein n=1 Tax=Utricularia reniformis TaxID=192314 RepID=A0A1Y0B4I1_9LAMI|nr:hypothetical protein AEK19_MT2148 [Utricularia reniformis]ART32298.1 hypothetical protein AEK19_MT2148 [Utricularia reniformis]